MIQHRPALQQVRQQQEHEASLALEIRVCVLQIMPSFPPADIQHTRYLKMVLHECRCLRNSGVVMLDSGVGGVIYPVLPSHM